MSKNRYSDLLHSWGAVQFQGSNKHWYGGMPYHYGIRDPHYPVPALRYHLFASNRGLTFTYENDQGTLTII